MSKPIVIYHRNCLDVASIARSFGGGGHRHAAGFESAAMLHSLVQPPRTGAS